MPAVQPIVCLRFCNKAHSRRLLANSRCWGQDSHHFANVVGISLWNSLSLIDKKKERVSPMSITWEVNMVSVGFLKVSHKLFELLSWSTKFLSLLIKAWTTTPRMVSDFHSSLPWGLVSTSPRLAVRLTFESFGASWSPLAYQTMVLSGIFAWQMQSKKRSYWFCARRKPKAKSPDEESQ